MLSWHLGNCLWDLLCGRFVCEIYRGNYLFYSGGILRDNLSGGKCLGECLYLHVALQVCVCSGYDS